MLLIILLAFAASLAAARIAGWGTYSVISGSMEPAYHTGSLIYVRPVPVSELSEGDVITYSVAEGVVATHRIVDVVADEDGSGQVSFATKGDANETADAGLVDGRNVIGTPVIAIPLLGYLISYLQRPSGVFAAVAVISALILIRLLAGLLGKQNDQNEGGRK